MPESKRQRWEIPESLRRKTIEVARDLRRTQTQTESILWKSLRGRKRGYKVRRQQPIDPFVVDFYIPQARLIVEVDGLIHNETMEVERNLEGVLREIDRRVCLPHPPVH